MRLCVFSDWYLPGAKGGGRVTALANLVASVGTELEISIVTRNHDVGSDSPYETVRTDAWNRIGCAQVFYSHSMSLLALRKLVASSAVDIIYLNSIFSRLSLRVYLLRLLGLVRCPVIIAPHGELNAGAMRIKRGRKLLFLRVAGKCGLYEGALWHATTDDEKKEILAIFPKVNEKDVFVARNIVILPELTVGPKEKTPGHATFLFVGRIGPKKNLRDAIKFISRLSGHVSLGIYGPVEDEHYWKECCRLLRELPCHIKAEYCGLLEPSEVHAALTRGHFFVFPTWGENYGYVVIEALGAGCPVICSSPTPWQKVVEAGAAWGIPLSNELEWVGTLQRCVDMDQQHYSKMAIWARRLAEEESRVQNAKIETLAMFQSAMEHGVRQGDAGSSAVHP
jgi:glycosyltransferase involved in cell wall biosynthesis